MAKILIIGGGVSGLSAGIYARLKGHEAIVCERHAIAGGNLTGWDRGGYHIDNCIHWLTGTNPATDTYHMWEELGALGNVEVYREEALFTCEKDGEVLKLNRDLRTFEQDMLRLSPKDTGEIRSFVKAVELMQGLCGIGGDTHDEKLSLWQSVKAVPAVMKYYGMTTGELSSRFQHPLLRFFFSAFWGEMFGAITLIFVFAHFCGSNADLPKGGSCAMAERMVARLLELGGELLLKKEAVKIHHDGERASSVAFADGSVIEADYVVLTGDPATTFGTILDLPMPKQLEKKYADPRLERFSSYHCAFACEEGALPFKGDFIFEIPERFRNFLNTRQLIVREFSHEAFAPAGRNLLETLTYAYEDKAKSFIELRKRDLAAYRQKKQELAETVRTLIEQKLPQLKDKLRCIDVWTPATYKRYVNSEIGSWMSFTLPSKIIPIRASNAVGALSNVVLATQWQQPPGGLPIAAEGGRSAIETIVKKEQKKQKFNMKGNAKHE
ncbi:MAG: NAD(P)/FAD-dependent oxidoreductase [Clostridia bacterium]|nr:NAD(P)/FAD-dependent oxidoreductase [Clostridia bacterium]